MISVALVEPEIPQNTGNIARLCAATRTQLHIVGVAGFRLDQREVRRAGLDYWDEVSLHRHRDIDELYKLLPDARLAGRSLAQKLGSMPDDSDAQSKGPQPESGKLCSDRSL